MKKYRFIYILIVLLHSNIYAQIDSASTDNRQYFGMEAPGVTPAVFAPGIISTDEFEFSGTFSKNGKEYFFTRRSTYEGSDTSHGVCLAT